VTCQKCGAELKIGAFPFCKGRQSDHGEGFAYVHGDECDFVQTNGLRHPRRFRSKQEWDLWRKQNHYEVKHKWDGTDRQTMENVRILMERAFGQSSEPEPDMHISTYTGELTPQEAAKYAGK